MRDDGEDFEDELLFNQWFVVDHQPATEALRMRIPQGVPVMTMWEMSFRDLAEREVREVKARAKARSMDPREVASWSQRSRESQQGF